MYWLKLQTSSNTLVAHGFNCHGYTYIGESMEKISLYLWVFSIRSAVETKKSRFYKYSTLDHVSAARIRMWG
jgi:hypothetical protein